MLRTESFKAAFDKGYRCVDGQVISPTGKVLRLKPQGHYPRFNIRALGKHLTVKAHQLCAYQKYGDEIFGRRIVVMHINDDPRDFKPGNIYLGTQKTNMKWRHATKAHKEKLLGKL